MARIKPFLQTVHVNMKTCSGIQHVQNIGRPVTFNTCRLFDNRQFSTGEKQ